MADGACAFMVVNGREDHDEREQKIMASAHQAANGITRERPISSPINTSVVDGTLSVDSLSAGVMVCGDTGNGKVMRVRSIAEQSILTPRKIVYFSNNDRCFGLHALDNSMLRFGAKTHAVPIGPNDGAFFADQFLTGDRSMAFDFSEMSVEDVSRFLSSFMQVVNRTKNVHADVFLESLDDLIGRKRHRDRNTVNTFKSMLLRGPAINGGNDVRVVVGATSPEEVPIETGRHTMTLIATCTANRANVMALSNYVRGDVRLTRYEDVCPWGIGFLKDHQHWIWPFADRMMHMPFYLELGELASNAGGGQPFKIMTSRGEKDVLDKLVAARKEEADRKRDSEANAPTARSRARVTECRPHRAGGIHGMGIRNASHRQAIGRCVLNIAGNGSFEPKGKVDRGLLKTRMLDSAYDVPAKWVAECYKIATLNSVISIALAGAAYVQARSENANAADAFFEGLGGMGANAAADGLKIHLAAMRDVPLLSAGRYDAVLSAFRSYARGDARPEAANDRDHPRTAA